jgi:hypothetical protein
MTDNQKNLTENTEKQSKIVETKLIKMDNFIEKLQKQLIVTDLNPPIIKSYFSLFSTFSPYRKYTKNIEFSS